MRSGSAPPHTPPPLDRYNHRMRSGFDRFTEHRKLGFFAEQALLLMTKPFTPALTGTWLLLAGLGSGCEPYSPHGSTEVGLVYDYIVRHDALVHGAFVVRPAGFYRYSGVSDGANLHGRTERLRAYLDSTLRPLLQPECLVTPNTSPEWQALRALLPTVGIEANVIFLAFSTRCDGRNGRYFYYVERHGVENGRCGGAYEGDIYEVYKGHIEREFHVWIS
jgi:hypothetical protein